MNFISQFIVWDFDPTIFSIGPLEIRYYSVMWMLAFVQGMIVLEWMLKREGEPKKYNEALFWYITLGTIIGARLGHVLFYEPMHYFMNPLEILNFREGGLASHGGTLGIMFGLFLFCRKYKKTYIWMLDRASMLGPLAACVIRIGNLFNSEIYGIETDKPWGFVFVRAGESVAKHPTQIYEALLYLLVFFVMFYLYKYVNAAKRFPGLMIGVMFVMIFVGRIFVENIKEIQESFEADMFFNMGQWLSIPFVLLGVFLIIKSFRNAKQ